MKKNEKNRKYANRDRLKKCGSTNKKMINICEEIYNNMIKRNNNKKEWLGINGKYLSEENVVQTLVRFAMPHPDLTMIDRMKYITLKQALAMKNKINHLETKSLNTLYIFLRQYIFLYHTKLIYKKEDYNVCEFSIGMLSQNYNKFDSCQNGLQGKTTTVKDTEFMGMGLFVGEDIKIDKCIVRYEGNTRHQKPKNNKSYVVEIYYRIRERDKDKKKTCYIDAEISTTNGRDTNHSCVNNAVR